MIIQLLLSVAILAVVPKLAHWTVELVSRLLPRKAAFSVAVKGKSKVFLGVLFAVVALVLVAWIWGLNWGRVLLLGSSLFAVIGVALFASWSVLSNITGFFVLISQRNLEHGARIRVVDAAHYVEGVITEVGLFHFELTTDPGNTILYPNNVLMTRPIMVLRHPEPYPQVAPEGAEAATKSAH